MISRAAPIPLALLALAGAACSSSARSPRDGATPERLEQASLIRLRGMGRSTAPDSAHAIAPQMADPNPRIAAEAAFQTGATGSPDAPGLVMAWLPADASVEAVSAAAMGLGSCKAAAAEDALVRLCLHASRPPEAPAALFSHYRWRGAPPAPTTLPDARLAEYERHPDAKGRAALGHLARAVKDPALIEPLLRLSKDAEWEVRRAAVLGLAEGSPDRLRPQADRARCLAGIHARSDDADARAAATVARALASYDHPALLAPLQRLARHADINVRVAAIEGLGRRKHAGAADTLVELARRDLSVSVRYTAAVQLAAIDATRAQTLVDDLLASDREYVRAAACEVLAKSDDPAVADRLADISRRDLHIRVRETALGGLEEKKTDSAHAAVRDALDDPDPVLVAVACAVAAKNGYEDLLPQIRALLEHHRGVAGADAREGAVAALAEIGDATDTARIAAHLDDPNPGVRHAAAQAWATRTGAAAPVAPRGVDREGGSLLPGGVIVTVGSDVRLVVETDVGSFTMQLDAAAAPLHAAHVASLAASGFYDGLTFHRVVPDFVIQGGCPRGDGAGNAEVTLPLEPTRIPFERGTVGMPRSAHLDSGGCQIFVCHSRAPHLDVQYTAFGRVVEGLDVIDRVDVDTTIRRIRVARAR